MKKLGFIAIAFIALTSCNGGANDGNANTDTTTFPSETSTPPSSTEIGTPADSTDRAPSTVGSQPSSPTSRSSTPGNQSGKEDSSLKPRQQQ